MKRNLKLSTALFICLSIIISMVFTGCAGDTGTSEVNSPDVSSPEDNSPEVAQTKAEEQNVTITFWHTYGDAEEPFFNSEVLPKFSEKFPNITVEAIRQTGDFNQILTAAFGTHQTPDVARIDISNTAPYANLGGIIELDSMEGFDEIKSLCLEGPLSTNLFKGKYYGLPLDTNCKAAVINMNLVKGLGLTEVPKTMEELVDASMKASSGKYTINVSGVGDWDMFPYFWLFGGVLTDDGFTKASGYLDSAQSIEAMQKIVELHDKKVFTVRDIDGTTDAWDGIESEYAMFFEGPWYFSSKPDYKDKNITCAIIPSYNGKSASVVGGENIVIFKDSKYPDEAYEFIKFMLSEEVQMMMLQKGQIPVLKTAIDHEAVQNDPVIGIYMKQLESAKSRIPSPQATQINTYWSDAVTSILTGDETPEAALKKAAELIDAELAK